MRGRRKIDVGLPDFGHWTAGRWAILLLSLPAFCLPVSGQSFSQGKNLFQLRESFFSPEHLKSTVFPGERFQVTFVRDEAGIDRFAQTGIPNPLSQIPLQPFLPRWSAECLPFFCRIEHDFAKKSAVPFKFRLGSVEYVDWLEGKSNW